jgi:hypothetical protein
MASTEPGTERAYHLTTSAGFDKVPYKRSHTVGVLYPQDPFAAKFPRIEVVEQRGA